MRSLIVKAVIAAFIISTPLASAYAGWDGGGRSDHGDRGGKSDRGDRGGKSDRHGRSDHGGKDHGGDKGHGHGHGHGHKNNFGPVPGARNGNDDGAYNYSTYPLGGVPAGTCVYVGGTLVRPGTAVPCVASQYQYGPENFYGARR